MKKFGFLLFLFVIMVAFPKGADASSYSAKIYLDGNELSLSSNVKVENISGTVMVPIRVISENLGYSVGWNKSTQTVTVKESGKTVEMVIGNKYAMINGQRTEMTKAPILRGGTTIVPIRFVSEQMGLNVKWDNQKKAVYLITPTTGGGEDGKLSTVNGISFSDNRLMVAVSGNVKPKVSKLSSPDRIVIDVENAKFSESFSSNNSINANLNGELIVTGYPDVKKVRYSLYNSNPSTVRIVIDLNYAKNYTLQGTESGSSLFIVDLNTSTVPGPDPGTGGKKLVVIDAGHGAHDPGAIGVTQKKEKDFTLALALKVGKLLEKEQNIDVVLTRSNDTFLELKDRVKIANDLKADAFVSIHANSGPSAATGTETYYQREASKSLANVLHKHIIGATGLKDRGVKNGNFHVIRETNMPAVLLEVGFLSNTNDESKLFNTNFQNAVAESIVVGLKEYLKVK
ncbi:N-acetylmuramoyl-L-alanine amidase family protein [Paenibacillus sp. N3/727]|uniref:N-acetylmuramoyl-L-alanine amidase family protein n=1 Tax=Paenibacillus sp. N3/727 TaxID=2925845 RepID=UPI001F53BADF|nr:N-acetylmuramoyl-L-alanine amidase family protein [Paenibacillus sp. N3/727]UNK20595.1 N-acetylmuramoyl-L-alanine amidase family protein [Paenibacillus sp. N3/727]